MWPNLKYYTGIYKEWLRKSTRKHIIWSAAQDVKSPQQDAGPRSPVCMNGVTAFVNFTYATSFPIETKCDITYNSLLFLWTSGRLI